MTEKLKLPQISNEEPVKVDWDEDAIYHQNDGKTSVDGEKVNKKAVGKGENIKEVKDKIIAFRGIKALKAVFTPEDDKLAKAA